MIIRPQAAHYHGEISAQLGHLQKGTNSLKLWPNKKQWTTWSLPSKLTAIGALLTLLTLSFYLVEKSFEIFEWASKEELRPEVSVNLQFPYEQLDGNIKQNKRNPELTVTNRGPITLSPITVDVNMFILSPTLETINSGAQFKYHTHGHLIFEPDLKPGKSVTASLAGIKNWTQPVAYDVRIKTIIQNDIRVPLLSLLFLVDENSIKGEGGNLEKEKAQKIKDAIQIFTKDIDTQKKVTLYAPLDGVWIPHADPGVDMHLNEDGTLTIK